MVCIALFIVGELHVLEPDHSLTPMNGASDIMLLSYIDSRCVGVWGRERTPLFQLIMQN